MKTTALGMFCGGFLPQNLVGKPLVAVNGSPTWSAAILPPQFPSRPSRRAFYRVDFRPAQVGDHFTASISVPTKSAAILPPQFRPDQVGEHFTASISIPPKSAAILRGKRLPAQNFI
jgi:hypothetical protein